MVDNVMFCPCPPYPHVKLLPERTKRALIVRKPVDEEAAMIETGLTAGLTDPGHRESICMSSSSEQATSIKLFGSDTSIGGVYATLEFVQLMRMLVQSECNWADWTGKL